jgi:Concanavalin A-like lectin/glucanases superfamily
MQSSKKQKPIRFKTSKIMAEFKFFCPQCGQRIQCETSYSGTQINCPVCTQPIVVPSAMPVPPPAAPSRAMRQGTPALAGGQTPVPAKPRTLRNVLVIAAAVVVLAGLIVGGWFGYSKIRIHNAHGHLPPGLVALWSADANANDSVGGNSGRLLNGAGFADGQVGKAFALHTLGDGVTAPAIGLPEGTSDRTMACWVYIKSYVPGAETFMAGYGNFGVAGQCYAFGLDVNHHVFFSQWGGGIVGPLVRPGSWHNVAVTSVGTNSIKLYLDGVNVASGALSFNTPPGSQFHIGEVKAPYARRQLIGLIDEVSVYNRALSDSEIQAVYTGQK